VSLGEAWINPSPEQQRSRPLTFAEKLMTENADDNEGFGSGWCVE
jgi:hypothetical protein